MTAPTLEASQQLQWRRFKDRFARYSVSLGGMGVIAALLLIFFYLVSIVLPLFSSPELKPGPSFARPGSGQPSLYLSLEEQNEIGLRATADGHLIFFSTLDGHVVRDEALTLPPLVTLESVQELDAMERLLLLQFSDGRVLVVQHSYKQTYPGNRRVITPEITYPLGLQPMAWAAEPVRLLTARMNGDRLLLVGIASASNEILIRNYDRQVSLIDDSVTLTPAAEVRMASPVAAVHLLLAPLMDWLYVISANGELAYFDLRDLGNVQLLQMVRVLDQRLELRGAAFLSGGSSVVFAGADSKIRQWFPVRDAENRYQLARIRDFEMPGAGKASALAVEQRRRGFVAGSDDGQISLYYATSGRLLLQTQLSSSAVRQMAISPRADALLVETADGQLHVSALDNHHPEVSWGALWDKVWYEGYAEPDYNWQSSAANNDFEPKLSLTPLTFGTFKAAFYAMLFAIPFAIMGAVYTAYFMAPRMRQWVKPGVEVIQALPSVILGFFAGLWLAPIVESNLAGIFGLLVLSPFVVILFGWGWMQFPRELRERVPDGWHALLLVPAILFFGWLCFAVGGWMDKAWFGGGLPIWLDQELGIDYDQRNALVVGMAMGFGVLPMIFSISEDAIFSVPKTLSNGSLALGATPWQTVVRVVLPTASPGIFSAVMIGFGRAVGETMIVLMATGNTAIMDFSIFQGLRTLSANIAVEMPEAEVASTHFRVLFLAGLVLFAFTFVFNTLGEVVRQRLREKYGNL